MYFILHFAGGKLGVVHVTISFSGKLLGFFFCFKFYSAMWCVLTWSLANSSQVSGAVQSSPPSLPRYLGLSSLPHPGIFLTLFAWRVPYHHFLVADHFLNSFSILLCFAFYCPWRTLSSGSVLVREVVLSWEEGLSTEELPPTDWPMRLLAFSWLLIDVRAPSSQGRWCHSPGSCIGKLAEHEPESDLVSSTPHRFCIRFCLELLPWLLSVGSGYPEA